MIISCLQEWNIKTWFMSFMTMSMVLSNPFLKTEYLVKFSVKILENFQQDEHWTVSVWQYFTVEVKFLKSVSCLCFCTCERFLVYVAKITGNSCTTRSNYPSHWPFKKCICNTKQSLDFSLENCKLKFNRASIVQN